MNSEQTQSVVHLARLIGGAIRRSGTVSDRLVEACLRCRDAGAPEYFTSLGLEMWRTIAGPGQGEYRNQDPGLRALLDRQTRTGEVNLETFREVARYLGGSPNGTLPPVLLGDAAVLLSLYGSVAAFEASLWVVALQGTRERLMRSGTAAVLTALPFDLRVCSAGRLEEPLRYLSRTEEVEGFEWCLPTGELMAALLAARVGDPEAVPRPPVWFHLAVAILGWKEQLDFDEMLELADDLELGSRVHRGLAITAAVFPEIRNLVPVDKLEIPMWERLLALPLATRRVVRESMRGGDDHEK